MAKLSDAEFTERTRTANRRRAERQRERLVMAGRAALTVWLPVQLRERVNREAAAMGMTINDMAVMAIEKGLKQSRDETLTLFSESPDPETADLFASPDPTNTKKKPDLSAANEFPFVSVGSDRDAMMIEVDRLLGENMTGADWPE